MKITSGHLLSEECDHLGEVDWSWGLSNLQGRDLMAKPQYLKKTHHVVGLAIADWPSNSLQHQNSYFTATLTILLHKYMLCFCYKTVLANIVNGRGNIRLKVLLESITRMSHYF